MNTTPTQAELANYITNTGCDWELFTSLTRKWIRPKFRWHTPAWCLLKRCQIRIALTPYGLPSHLPPHNPAGLSAEQITEGGKYRAVTANESASQEKVAECFDEVQAKWIKAATFFKGISFGVLSLTYRLPATVPFPDWEEMSKAAEECPPCPVTECQFNDSRMTGHCSAEVDEAPLYPSCKKRIHATVKESLAPQPALRVIDVPLKVAPREQSERRTSQPTPMQPAPGETRETDNKAMSLEASSSHPGIDAIDDPNGIWVEADFARTLERQRNQAREEKQFYKDEREKLAWELHAANADRVRLREALEPFTKNCSSDEFIAILVKCADVAEARKALSTPPPCQTITPINSGARL